MNVRFSVSRSSPSVAGQSTAVHVVARPQHSTSDPLCVRRAWSRCQDNCRADALLLCGLRRREEPSATPEYRFSPSRSHPSCRVLCTPGGSRLLPPTRDIPVGDWLIGRSLIVGINICDNLSGIIRHTTIRQSDKKYNNLQQTNLLRRSGKLDRLRRHHEDVFLFLTRYAKGKLQFVCRSHELRTGIANYLKYKIINKPLVFHCCSVCVFTVDYCTWCFLCANLMFCNLYICFHTIIKHEIDTIFNSLSSLKCYIVPTLIWS